MTPAEAAKHTSADGFAWAVALALHERHPDQASQIVDRISKYQQGLARGERIAGIHNETWLTDNLPEGDPERTKR